MKPVAREGAQCQVHREELLVVDVKRLLVPVQELRPSFHHGLGGLRALYERVINARLVGIVGNRAGDRQ